ncbi:MAG: Tm-1-like ATP-binding domain-containing protein [Planctomycetes bacterium]|nr:Tm-1-like ATP-binding domain-containing protein [Planctomycetota bacterium]MCH9725118.1 Tm-1-like ATP-binding domain-containing protein [Planctomycetota bacterium]MCH9774920.1 Tm-1-like ATP-binding domain-containing protein [Planctomycetota bacterium]MCH9789323.1 Tm-1-like ATP-binding domain-containing protein [Planctomycetota bacterium]
MGQIIYAMATMDTKGDELCFVADCIRRIGLDVVLVDLSTQGSSNRADITARTVAQAHPAGPDQVLGQSDRGQAVTKMSEALQHWLSAEVSSETVAGVIALGGSGGTAIVAPALQALPIGLPKLIVSTVASGNTQPYVGHSDITMMYSVVDVAGLNSVSRQVLSNAAHAITGMVAHACVISGDRPAIGMTMFGVTTPCVDMVRETLETKGFDPLVFHATGTGGQAMEKLVSDGLIGGVLDITTTEVADEVVGGIMPGGPHRFDAIIESGIPYIMSLGALDMVNFGARQTVPERFTDRHFLIHNPQVTLMRTTVEENRQIAKWIAEKVNRSTAPVEILIPEQGVSMLDSEGEAFYDPQADQALFDTLEQEVQQTDTRRITRHPCHINDSVFAKALVAAFERVCENRIQ